MRDSGISIFPSGSPWVRDWVNLGISLSKRLEAKGFDCIEVYPYATRRGLDIGSLHGSLVNKKLLSGRMTILHDLERLVKLRCHRGDLIHDHDRIDAVLSALTAHYWTKQRDLMVKLRGDLPFVVPRALFSEHG